MNLSGSLVIRARLADGELRGLTACLQRPPMARLFVGQPVAAVPRIVPLLFSLCARGQRRAAELALAAAGGDAPEAGDDGGLWREFLHETLWRLLLDWPRALGLPPAEAEFVAWRGARAEDGVVEATRHLLSGALEDLAGKCRARLVDRSVVTDFDPPGLTPAEWLAYWQGATQDLPAWSRPATVAGAWERRLAEAHVAAAALAGGQPCPTAAAGGDGCGIGQVWTARGVLTHAVRLKEGRVSGYRVWAPTDRHFADAGGLAALLAGHRFDDRMAAQNALEQAILALDPCLPYTLEWDDA